MCIVALFIHHQVTWTSASRSYLVTSRLRSMLLLPWQRVHSATISNTSLGFCQLLNLFRIQRQSTAFSKVRNSHGYKKFTTSWLLSLADFCVKIFAVGSPTIFWWNIGTSETNCDYLRVRQCSLWANDLNMHFRCPPTVIMETFRIRGDKAVDDINFISTSFL